MKSISTISTKGQVVIPAKLRKKHRLEAGVQVRIFEYGNLICITPASEHPVDEAYGTLTKEPSLTKELLQERAKDFTKCISEPQHLNTLDACPNQ